MKSYKNLGLDSQLRKARNKPEFTSGNEFDATMDYSVITARRLGTAVIGNAQLGTAIIGTAQIGTLSFNEITGGTATLGGTLDGDGVFTLNNESGVQVIQMNKDGMVNTGRTVQFGSSNEAAVYFADSLGRFLIEALSDSIILETNGEKEIKLFADSGTVEITIGTAHMLRVKNGSGGTLMELDGSTGNLDIAGALGTGVSF